MTLRAEFEARFSVARVIQLTNPDVKASSVDDARLDLAVKDAEAQFEDWVNAELDLGNPRHVAVAVSLVEVMLIERGTGGLSAAQSLRSSAEAAATQLRDTSVTSRQPAQTNQEGHFVDPPPNPSGQPVVPWSSKEGMSGMLPRERGAG